MPSRDLIFDKYEIVRRIAVGGMGEIFLARETNAMGIDRVVILKNLLPELARQPGFVAAFLDEARVAATLNHPNVVAVYEVGAWGGVHFICMEYIEGENVGRMLDRVVDRGERIPPRVAARVVRDAAMGLAHAHDATRPDGTRLDIVHRDISPQNIMVRLDGVVKVVDFGIALAKTRQTRTATGLIKGKVRYLAPEQISGDRELDGRADQYALGVVFWEMLTGRPLFDATNESLVMHTVMHGTLQPPSAFVPDLPEIYDRIVMRMLSREREHRYSDCRAVADAIDDGIFASAKNATSEALVAAFVSELVGDEISQRRQEMTPSRDYVVRLTSSRDTVREPALAPARRSSAKWVALAIPLILLAGAAGAWLRWRTSEPVPVALVAPAEPLIAVVPTPSPQSPPERVPPPVSEPEPDRKPRKPPGIAKAPKRLEMRVGYLSLRTRPWTRVSVAGRDLGSTPIASVELPAGTHTLELVNRTKQIATTRTVEIKPGEVTKLDLALE